MVAAQRLDVRQGDVVAQGQALLDDLLRRVAPAYANDTLEILADKIGVERRRFELVIKIIDAGFVLEIIVVVLPAQVAGVDVVLVDRCRFLRCRTAEARCFGLHPDAARKVDPVVLVGLEGQLGKAEVLAERAGKGAFETAEARQVGGRALAQPDIEDAVLVIAFVGDEEIELVLDDRSADRPAILLAAELALRPVIELFEIVLRAQVLVLVKTKHFAVELIATRFGHCGDHRHAGVFIFRFVIGTEHPEFLDGALRKRVAAARIAADEAALLDVRLEADAIDKDIDLRAGKAFAIGVLADAATAEGLAELVLAGTHTRRQIGKIEEVAAGLRQILDLAGGDVGADFRRPRLDQPRSGDDGHHFFGRRRQIDIERRCLADTDDHPARDGLAAGGKADVIGAWTQPRQGVVAGRSRSRARYETAIDVARRDHRARACRVGTGDAAADGRGGQLRCRRHSGHDRRSGQKYPHKTPPLCMSIGHRDTPLTVFCLHPRRRRRDFERTRAM